MSDQMSKTIKKLEKENITLKKKAEKSDVTVIDLLDEVSFVLIVYLSYLHPIRKLALLNGNNISLMPKVEVSSTISCASVFDAVFPLLHLRRVTLQCNHLILKRECQCPERSGKAEVKQWGTLLSLEVYTWTLFLSLLLMRVYECSPSRVLPKLALHENNCSLPLFFNFTFLMTEFRPLYVVAL